MKKVFLFFHLFFIAAVACAEDGYTLWLNYSKIDDATLLQQYRSKINSVQFTGNSLTVAVAKKELLNGLQGLLAISIADKTTFSDRSIVAGTPLTSTFIQSFLSEGNFNLGKEGFVISTKKADQKNIIIIAANSDVGVLYGVFQFLRLLQTHQSIEKLSIVSIPKIQNRILDHWDNLNRTVERGYAGVSIWNWHLLPGYIDKRYIDYARANASIGINGTVLTNVNANAMVLTKPYLEKVAALANVFRPYGIKVYLTARFSAPIEIGGLKTADPLDAEVQNWWKQKCDEIYSYIPDFGGFVVKANSEGQPGPQNYGRTHADGANMFADALAPHHGIVMWRAFVYEQGFKKVPRILVKEKRILMLLVSLPPIVQNKHMMNSNLLTENSEKTF